MLNELHDRVRGVDLRLLDAGLALLALVAIELTCWLTGGISTSDRLITAVAAVPFAAPVTVRRTWPGATLLLSAAVVMVAKPFGSELLTDDNAYVIPVLALGYSAGALLGMRRSALAMSAALVLLATWALLPGPVGSPTGFGQSAWSLFYVSALLIPTWLVGRFVRRRGVRAEAFRELAAKVEAEQDAHDAAAIASERQRIGSELQDIIAHSISAMVIQAGSARLLLRSDPGRARDSILSVEETGRQALSDVRRLLGMLRKDDDPRALSPQPGLSQLTALINSLRDAGLTCEREVVGDPIDLTPGIDLVAYRVIETALRAAAGRGLRHGLVTIRYGSGEIELSIRGERAIPNLDAAIVPLGQRLALYDGELRTEQTPHGFMLSARVPFEAGVPV